MYDWKLNNFEVIGMGVEDDALNSALAVPHAHILLSEELHVPVLAGCFKKCDLVRALPHIAHSILCLNVVV